MPLNTEKGGGGGGEGGGDDRMFVMGTEDDLVGVGAFFSFLNLMLNLDGTLAHFLTRHSSLPLILSWNPLGQISTQDFRSSVVSCCDMPCLSADRLNGLHGVAPIDQLQVRPSAANLSSFPTLQRTFRLHFRELCRNYVHSISSQDVHAS